MAAREAETLANTTIQVPAMPETSGLVLKLQITN